MPAFHPSIISFDCYGTLVDWEAGITSFLQEIFREKRVEADIAEVVKVREDLDFNLVQGEYRSYREVLSLTLKETFGRFQIPYNVQDGERLAESVSSWPVFEETRPALQKLARKRGLVIISNIDKDIIEKTRSNIGVGFRLIVTAEEARAYKPNAKPFELTLRKLGCDLQEILHVSSGFRYDIPPASRLGIRTAWVNRKQEKKPAGVHADHEFRNLTELAEFVEKIPEK